LLFLILVAVSWQLGLVEREINDLLQGIAKNTKPKSSAVKEHAAMAAITEEADVVSGPVALPVVQREIGATDVCPICQDELLAAHAPVTYCRLVKGSHVLLFYVLWK